jgi:hypothetical protein
MNLVLDVIEQRLGRRTLLVWVDGGPAELSMLDGLPVPVVLWSSRYLEQTAAIRSLLLDGIFIGHRRVLARRMALTVLAEGALRSGQPDLAAKCLVGAELDRGLIVPNANLLSDLETAPISEASVALWYFGLTHEFGHSRPEAEFALGPLSDNAIIDALRATLADMSVARRGLLDPDTVLAGVHSAADHPLRPSHVRAEAQADLFAAEVLLDATPTLFERTGHGQPDPMRLLIEVLVATCLISFAERCRWILNAVTAPGGRRSAATYPLAPAALTIRQLIVRDYSTDQLGPRPGAHRAVDIWRHRIEAGVDQLQPAVADLDNGLADAVSFVVNRDVDVPTMIDKLAEQTRGVGGSLIRIELQHLLPLAVPHRGASSDLDHLVGILHEG